jgi:hypothetical protein
MSKKITVRELEAKILEKEEIVVVIRASAGTLVEDYPYARKAAGNTSVTDFSDGRLKESIGDLEFAIVNGNHTSPHGRTKLSTLRESYEN